MDTVRSEIVKVKFLHRLAFYCLLVPNIVPHATYCRKCPHFKQMKSGIKPPIEKLSDKYLAAAV